MGPNLYRAEADMPLTRAPDPSFNPTIDGIDFAMIDDKQHRIVCHVSRETLQDRGARDGRDLDPPIDLFDVYRSEVEAVASRKYDTGSAKPVVTSDDLWR